jgi:Ca2+/H+ antiporter
MRGRVNMMQGVVHLLIFATWIMVIFDESWALNV